MQNFFTSLDAQDLLAVSGEDSEKFLQGQLTCDLAGLSENHCLFGAACNNKGRVFASFRLLHLDGEYILSMPEGVAEMALAALKKYIPFYPKAEMTECSDRFNRFGLAGDNASAWLEKSFPELPAQHQALTGDNMVLINISSTPLPRFELWLKTGAEQPLIDEMKTTLPEGTNTDWELLDHEDGIVFLKPEDAELYTPEELNLDLGGFVSFGKGCYTGQEIVARMHYRGKAKKRLFRIQFQSSGESRDRSVFNDQESTVGMASNLLYLKDNYVTGFVVLKSDTGAGTPLWVHTADGKTSAKITSLAVPEPE